MTVSKYRTRPERVPSPPHTQLHPPTPSLSSCLSFFLFLSLISLYLTLTWPRFTAADPNNIVLEPLSQDGSPFIVEQNMGRPDACALWDEVEAFNNVNH